MIVEVDSALSRSYNSACYRFLSLTCLEYGLFLFAQAGMPPISSANWATVMKGTLSFDAFAWDTVLWVLPSYSLGTPMYTMTLWKACFPCGFFQGSIPRITLRT